MARLPGSALTRPVQSAWHYWAWPVAAESSFGSASSASARQLLFVTPRRPVAVAEIVLDCFSQRAGFSSVCPVKIVLFEKTANMAKMTGRVQYCDSPDFNM